MKMCLCACVRVLIWITSSWLLIAPTPAHAGAGDYFYVFHWLTGQVQDATGGNPSANGREVSAYFGEPAQAEKGTIGTSPLPANRYAIDISPRDRNWFEGSKVTSVLVPRSPDNSTGFGAGPREVRLDKSGLQEVGAMQLAQGAGADNRIAVNLTLYLEGYYDPVVGSSLPMNVSIVARSLLASSAPSPERARTRAGEARLTLSNGTGVGRFSSAGLSPGNYYLVVRTEMERSGVASEEGIHFRFITANPVVLSSGVNAINFSDPASSNFIAAYTPTGKVEALKTSGGKKLARTGDINGDRLIDVRDFAMWRGKFEAPAGQRYGLLEDLNGDGLVDVRDFSFWRGNFEEFGSRRQLDRHAYDPGEGSTQ